MKKSIILISIILTCCLFAGAASASSAGGLHDGTYLIYDAADLTAFATYINSDITHVATNAKLMADIDLTGVTWTPIGTSSNAYAGTFDGNGNRITIAFTANSQNYGLFGNCNGATIKNVGVDGTLVTSTYDQCAPLVANFIISLTVQNSYTDVDITCGGGNQIAGFVAGNTASGTLNIENCYVLGNILEDDSVTTNYYYTGGVFASRTSTGYTSTYNIKNTYYAGTIALTHGNRVGGIVGYLDKFNGGSQSLDADNLVVLSSSITSATYKGRFLGMAYQNPTYTITNSYYNGILTSGTWSDSSSGSSVTSQDYTTENWWRNTVFGSSDYDANWYWDTDTSLPKLQVFREQTEAPSISSVVLTSNPISTVGSQSTAYVVASSNIGETLSYQWAYSTNSAVSWINISNQITANLSYIPESAGMYYLKVLVSDSSGTTDSYDAGFTTAIVNVLAIYTPGNVTTRTSSIQAKTLETYQATNEFDFGSTILDVKYLGDTSAVVAAGNAIYMVDGEGATIAPLTSVTGNIISKAYLGKTRAIINDVDNNVAVYDYANQTMTYIATNGSNKVAISPNYAYVVNDTGWLNIYNATNQIVASVQYTYPYLEVNQETDIFGGLVTYSRQPTTQSTYAVTKVFHYYSFDGSTITARSYTYESNDGRDLQRIHTAKPIDNTNSWILYGNNLDLYILTITNSGSGSTTTHITSLYTVNSIDVSKGFSSIFSQNAVIYVYGNNAVLQGEYTTGGNLNDVSIANSNGLYAIGAGNDSNAYFINKEASASWVLGQATNFNENVYHSQMSYDGNQALIGTTNKLFLFKYSESVESSFYINGVVVGSDGLPYANKIIQIDANSVMTDDSGFFVYPVKPGQTYTIITGSKTTRYTATNQALQTLSIKITSQLISQDVTYGASYNSTSGNIEMNYNDAVDRTSIVVWSVRDTKTGQEVSRQSVSAGTQAYYFVPANKTSDNYFVTVAAQRGNSTVKNTWSITPSGQGQTVNLFGMDDTGKNILFGFFIILLAGLFGYLHQHIGTIIVAFAAAVLRYLGLITVPWIMIIIAVVVAIVAAIAHRGEGK